MKDTKKKKTVLRSVSFWVFIIYLCVSSQVMIMLIVKCAELQSEKQDLFVTNLVLARRAGTFKARADKVKGEIKEAPNSFPQPEEKLDFIDRILLRSRPNTNNMKSYDSEFWDAYLTEVNKQSSDEAN